MVGVYLLHVNRKRLEEGKLQRGGLQKSDRSRMGLGTGNGKLCRLQLDY